MRELSFYISLEKWLIIFLKEGKAIFANREG
jgi:hypothetical protein